MNLEIDLNSFRIIVKHFSTFLRISSEDKLTPLQLKRSSVTQSAFYSRALIILLFFNLFGVSEHLLCANNFKQAVLISHY